MAKELEEFVFHALKDQFEGSPFASKLGVEAVHFEDGRAVFKLPFTEDNTTIADVVHGGAILTLADIAATAAAWAGIENPADHRGITADLSLTFLSAGRSQALTADAQILRRGKTLTYLEVDVKNEDGEAVAKALVTYKLSKKSKA
jgi:uncharacterized protein (TIGR00369 family)